MNQQKQFISSCSSRGSSSNVQILAMEKITRPTGYSLPNTEAISITVSRDGLKSTGFGEGTCTMAEAKALSEAIERSVLKEFAHHQGISETSNGWSCHLSAPLAIENAVFELIERDVALTTWQNGGPFFQVAEELWPYPLQTWKANLQPLPEFFDLKILLSATTNGACISALLFNDRGNFVAGHASAENLESAIVSATAECFRAAHSAVRFEHFAEVLALHSPTLENPIVPGAHSLAYAYTVALPQSVKIVTTSSSDILEKWTQHQQVFQNLNMRDFDISLFHVDDHVVARVKCEKYRQIFWGKDPEEHQNNNPHFVG